MLETARPVPRLTAPLGLAAALGLAAVLGLAPAHAQPQNPTAPENTMPGAPAATAPATAPAPAPAKPPAAATAPTGKAAQGGDEDVVNDTSLVMACKQKALVLLRASSPKVEDIFIDMDGLTVAKADTMVGNAKVIGVMMGEAYIQREKTDRVHRFLCLTGEGGKVLMTFFTER